MKVIGIVEGLQEKTTSYGPMHIIKMNGLDYTVGKYPPRDVRQGDTVEFEFTESQNGRYTNRKIVAGTIRKSDAAPSQQRVAASTAPAACANKFVPNDERQTIISKQAALNTALSQCNLALAAGALPFPDKTKAADKLDLIEAWVLETAAKFYNLSTGQTWELPKAAAVKEEALADEANDAWPEDE